MMRLFLLSLFYVLTAATAWGAVTCLVEEEEEYVRADSVTGSRWGGVVHYMPGRQMPVDEYARQWIRGKEVHSVAVEVSHTALPSDSDAFAADYGYPSLSVGVAYDFNHGVTMHRYPSPSWGMAQEVDYHSVLGNSLSLYGAFTRPLLRSRHWELAYIMRMGVGFSEHRYNQIDAIDNELIGSFATIYIGASFSASYFFTPQWAVTAGVGYHHHSNGALHRPNKGENTWGPMVGLVYAPAHQKVLEERRHRVDGGFTPERFKRFWYVDVAAGLGAKTLLEDWQLTQFHTAPTEPDYRTRHFHLYAAYSMQLSLMHRYARRWASGIGADVFYATYCHRVREVDAMQVLAPESYKVSPWSVGLAARHEVYYHQWSLAMSLGVYLHRYMGMHAKNIEKPYYERIGLHYSFPRWGGLYTGVNVNAHFTKADFTEWVVGIPLQFRKARRH